MTKPNQTPDFGLGTNLELAMAKKKAGNTTKSNAKAAKKAKAAQKVERREKKQVSKSKDNIDDGDEDLEGILEKVFLLCWSKIEQVN